MVDQKIYILENNNWVDRTKEFIYLIEQSFTLDETLDSAMIKSITEKREIYPRNTKMKIVMADIDENSKITYTDTQYYIANDKSSLMRNFEPYLYEHSFMLIEPTKLLERLFINGMSVTQPLNDESNIKNIAQVIDSLLVTNPFRKVGENPLYFLDENLRQRLSKINSCEFKWSCKMHLREVLKEIGAFIGAEPRLAPNPQDDRLYDTISFDFFGVQGKDISNLKFSAWQEDCYEDQYCTELETYAENLIAQSDESQSTTTYPSKNGWITPRSTQGLRIKDDNAEIVLPEKIYKITKLLVCNFKIEYEDRGGKKTIDYTESNPVDLTNQLYEEEKWNLLKNTDGTQAERGTKESSISYKQGTNIINITYLKKYMGLTQSAIRNAIKVATGYTNPVNDVLTYNIKTLYFQIEYIPLQPTKVKTVRQNMNDKNSNTLAYNQQAEYNDSKKLGRHMWEVCQRLGAETQSLVYYHKNVSKTPQIGDTYNGLIVTSVTRKAIGANDFCTMIIASKDYNRLSEKIGINRKYRQWSIPAESIEKNLHYQDYCIIENTPRDDTSIALIWFGEMFRNLFEPNRYKDFNGLYQNTEIDCATLQGNGCNKVLLSVQSRAFANSLLFSFRTKDNYSCGLKKTGDEIIDVAYSNQYGKFDTCNIVFGTDIKNIYYQDDLPLCPNGIKAFASADFVVKKDSSEQINMTYQMHIITPLSKVVIGELLTENNPLVKEWHEDKKFKYWELNKPISKFAQIITGEGTESKEMNHLVSGAKGCMKLEITNIPKAAQGWAITDEHGRLYIAENEIKSNSRTLYFNFRHNY